MEHQFNVNFAKKYGIEEAILIHNMYFWINKNAVNNKHLYHEHYWIYNTQKALSDLFPYIHETKIQRSLKHLYECGFIIKGNFNKNKLDRTCWYAFSDEALSILQNEGYDISKMKNANLQNEVTIPYSKHTDSNTDEKEDTNVSNKESSLEGGRFSLEEYNNSIAADIDSQNETRGRCVKKTKRGNSFDVRCDLSYVSDEYRSMWNEWLDYKDEIKKQYKTQTGAKKAYTTWINASDNNPVLANAILQRSIEMSWEGLSTLSEKQKSFFLSDKSPYRDKSITQEIYNPIVPSKYR